LNPIRRSSEKAITPWYSRGTKVLPSRMLSRNEGDRQVCRIEDREKEDAWRKGPRVMFIHGREEQWWFI
jgi:hypothetical protein